MVERPLKESAGGCLWTGDRGTATELISSACFAPNPFLGSSAGRVKPCLDLFLSKRANCGEGCQLLFARGRLLQLPVVNGLVAHSH